MKPDESWDGNGRFGYFPAQLYMSRQKMQHLLMIVRLGPKPYYIYRGGIGGDTIDTRQQLLDEINFKLNDMPFKLTLLLWAIWIGFYANIYINI